MANIQRGATGTATFVGNGGAGFPGPNEWFLQAQTVASPYTQYGLNDGNPANFQFHPGGGVEVPSSAQLGGYRVSIIEDSITRANKIYDFTVIEAVPEEWAFIPCDVPCTNSVPPEYEGTTYSSYELCKVAFDAACPPGRYICDGAGNCEFIPGATAPAGFASMTECLRACAQTGGDGGGGGGEEPCMLAVQMGFSRILTDEGEDTNQFSVSAYPSGATPPVAFRFLTELGDLAFTLNDDGSGGATTILNHPGSGSISVNALVTDANGCFQQSQVVITNDKDTGSGECQLQIQPQVIVEGGGNHLLIINHTGATSLSLVFAAYLGGVALTSLTGKPNQFAFNVPYGQTKDLAMTLFDGACADAKVLPITNGNNCSGDGGTNPDMPSPDDECAARLGIYYRDIKAETTAEGVVIWNSRFGSEVWPDCINPACQYWYQFFGSSDADLFGDYGNGTDGHFPLTLSFGAKQTASGNRIARYQVNASNISRPATQHVHVRVKATPVFQKVPFDLVGNVIKIRPETSRSLFIFTDEARAYRWTAPAEGVYGPGAVSLIFDLSTIDAGDASDAAILGDKLFVIAPGELFAVDLTTGESTLNYGIRGETRAPVFVEVVGTKPIAIYQDNAATPKVRCYDLSYPTPKLAWTSVNLVTKTEVIDGKLFLACGASLYSSAAGTATPVLVNTFEDDITAIAPDYIGLDNGKIFRKFPSDWVTTETLVGPAGGIWPWYGGASAMRALAGAASGANAETLRAEQTNFGWYDDISLEDATGVTAMRALVIEVEAATETQPAKIDEWQLIGDDNEKLWGYTRSAITEADGAVKGCKLAALRLSPSFQPQS